MASVDPLNSWLVYERQSWSSKIISVTMLMLFLTQLLIQTSSFQDISLKSPYFPKKIQEKTHTCYSIHHHRNEHNLFKLASSSYDDDWDVESLNLYHEWREKRTRPMRNDIRDILRKMKHYYYGYEEKDMGVMKNLWCNSDSVKVIVPDTGMLVGHDEVMGNLRKIFFPPSGEDEVSNKIIYPSDINLQLRGSTAWVTSVEEMKGKTQGPLGPVPMNFPKMRVTTILRKERGEWKILMRQLSQLSPVQIKNQDESTRRREQGSIVIHAEEGVEVHEEEVGSVVSNLKARLNSPTPSPSQTSNTPTEEEPVKKGKVSFLAYNEETGKHEIKEMYNGQNEADPKDEKLVQQSVKSEDPRQVMRRTVEALRRLCEEERISVEQKRILLSDVIQHATKENASMVEIAFSLLMDGLCDQEADEEFADQCRIFADQLLAKAAAT